MLKHHRLDRKRARAVLTTVAGTFVAFAAFAAVAALAVPRDASAAERTAIRPPYRGAGGSADPIRPGCPTDDPCRVVTEPRDFSPPPSGPVEIEPGVFQVNESIYMAEGFGNTFLVVTDEGNVIIDTSLSLFAPAHQAALRRIDDGPVKYIILTHGHEDHTGGVGLWREPETVVISQQDVVDLQNYQRRLSGLGRFRNAAQFSELLGLPPLPYDPPDAPVVNYGGTIHANRFFERFTEFELGGLTFQLVHTPGETPDHVTVWIPQYKAAFTGDNFYVAFPNLYTLRGTRPRWALDYVESLDRVLSWKPEILAPSHGNPIYGSGAVRDRVESYRDAIQYVHDETVQGLNAGKDVYTLMQEIRLPPDLDTEFNDEVYGRIDWSVRGIADGYVGWFDANVSNMYPARPESVHAEVVEMAGGADAVAERARAILSGGDPQRALHMSDMALRADAENRTALEVRRDAVQTLLAGAVNLNERGWLTAALREVEAKLP